MSIRGVCRRVLKLPTVLGRFPGEISYCRQPDSGNPTVRDERGLSRNVDYGELGTRRTYRKSANRETLGLRLRALLFYPTDSLI